MRRVVILVLAGLLFVTGWLWLVLLVPYQGFAAAGVFVEIPRGASRRSVARLLRQNGVVRSRLGFELLTRFRPKRTLQAGEYFFQKPATALEVFKTIANGRVYEHSVTLPEGLTVFDMADLLEHEGLFSRESFLEAAQDPTPIADLAADARSLEGFLFPATYQFPRKVAPQEVVNAMVRRFRETWASLPEAGHDGRSVEAIVTLASLVERETPVPEERPIIAGVFSNRLRIGLPLQCDPTVIYALRLAGRYDGALDIRSLRIKSPYNTYRHAGLPPGPIANPGVLSLRAVLAPAPVDYLYFVANTHGGHFFSRTLAEHNRNVARYRHLLAENGKPGGNPPNDPPVEALRKSAPRHSESLRHR